MMMEWVSEWTVGTARGRWHGRWWILCRGRSSQWAGAPTGQLCPQAPVNCAPPRRNSDPSCQTLYCQNYHRSPSHSMLSCFVYLWMHCLTC